MEDSQKSFPKADCIDATGKLLLQQLVTSTLIHSEALLSNGEHLQMENFLGLSLDEKGRFIRNLNENPLLNTLIYDFEFPDGNIKKYGANIIAENILVNCDSEGHYLNLMSCIF